MPVNRKCTGDHSREAPYLTLLRMERNGRGDPHSSPPRWHASFVIRVLEQGTENFLVQCEGQMQDLQGPQEPASLQGLGEARVANTWDAPQGRQRRLGARREREKAHTIENATAHSRDTEDRAAALLQTQLPHNPAQSGCLCCRGAA
eukprot:TRINITY_DN9067_c0_g2_i1.p2 TRINITY_DN9067_c0_g2~~TRINITY_DN9067_c0_g2_i1.p2  ORF type:complete len:147 (-),score=0.38 TRINITY_DN9067_c0_g2_i1:76-516(-)